MPIWSEAETGRPGRVWDDVEGAREPATRRERLTYAGLFGRSDALRRSWSAGEQDVSM